MESEEIKLALIEYIKNRKTKTINITEIYQNLKLPYSQNSDKTLHIILNELIEENYITPLKNSEKTIQGSYKKYRIIKQRENIEELKIKEELLRLDKQIDISYYLKHPEEYIKEKENILQINNFLKNPDKNILSVNERSYQIFKNEKLLKEKEEILKRVGLTLENLFCYDTYEPFFCYINSNFNKETKTVLIIENKDTFWTIQKIIEEMQGKTEIALLIYGEGKKILKSFPYIESFGITSKDVILYFGDIDYEGINIYISLKKKWKNFNIKAFKKCYEMIVNLENNPPHIRTNQKEKKEDIQEFLEEFTQEYQMKLREIFKQKQYIPQEVFNYNVAKNVMK